MLAVLYLDLDSFKSVNDKFGHSCGDELLIAVSNHIRAALREGDIILNAYDAPAVVQTGNGASRSTIPLTESQQNVNANGKGKSVESEPAYRRFMPHKF